MNAITQQLVIPLILLIFFAGCSEPTPQPIQFGSDQGEYCRMMITEPQFASQVLNRQGRAYKFDSIECMAAFLNSTADEESMHSAWVPAFENPEQWLRAEESWYLHSETLRSPMGLYLSAYPDYEAAERFQDEYRGEILRWDEVRHLVRTEWLSGSLDGNEVDQNRNP